MKIINERLICHSTPLPTQYELEIKCDCGEEFYSCAFQYWKNEMEKDGDRVLDYKYCPYCGKQINMENFENE